MCVIVMAKFTAVVVVSDVLIVIIIVVGADGIS